MPATRSVWEDTRTFFPIFHALLLSRQATSAIVVGASDGKFVLPLARAGIHVTAIEPNSLALEGGPTVLPGHGDTTMPGLRKRLADEGLTDQVTIVHGDLLTNAESIEPADAVWTSCSWHYSLNHDRPLEAYVLGMQQLCAAGGILGAEYMMPVEPRHFSIEHYSQEGHVRRFFPNWHIDWETYTPPFVELPHVEQPDAHIHRTGLIIATRGTESSR